MKTMRSARSIISLMIITPMLFLIFGYTASSKVNESLQTQPSAQWQGNLIITKPKRGITKATTVFEYSRHGFTLVKTFDTSLDKVELT